MSVLCSTEVDNGHILSPTRTGVLVITGRGKLPPAGEVEPGLCGPAAVGATLVPGATEPRAPSDFLSSVVSWALERQPQHLLELN